MTGGVLLVVAGAWVLCQILGGNALGRLGITGDPDSGEIVKKFKKQTHTPTLERGD